MTGIRLLVSIQVYYLALFNSPFIHIHRYKVTKITTRTIVFVRRNDIKGDRSDCHVDDMNS